MKIMYIKYIHGTRQSIIKEDEKIIINASKIIPFEPIKKVKIDECTFNSNKKNIITSTFNDKTNEEITAFFFDAIHKNYLLNKKIR
jgi:hypothetical protein